MKYLLVKRTDRKSVLPFQYGSRAAITLVVLNYELIIKCHPKRFEPGTFRLQSNTAMHYITTPASNLCHYPQSTMTVKSVN